MPKRKESEGLRRTHTKDRPAPKTSAKKDSAKRYIGGKTVSLVAPRPSRPIVEVAGSQTLSEYGKPNCLADII